MSMAYYEKDYEIQRQRVIDEFYQCQKAMALGYGSSNGLIAVQPIEQQPSKLLLLEEI